jgi:UDP-N-acetylmuramoyl-tripeptide--D-alanyl-D-alanine ligase
MEFIKRKDKVLIINDSYNANPSSMKAALLVLASQPAKRRIAVLGDMLELGKKSKFYHQQVLNFAKKLGIDLIFTKGRNFGNTLNLADLKKHLRSGDTILVKGSRGMKMEQIVDTLRF